MPVRILRTIGVLLLVLPMIVYGVTSIPVMAAADLELRGTELGLEVIPEGSVFFDLRGMTPGDLESGVLTIRNTDTNSFDLFMKAEKKGLFEPIDLFNKLKLKITFREAVLFDGDMKIFATSSISLGRLQPSEVQELQAVVSLPGPETGNEYQGKQTEVIWIFTANSIQPTSPTTTTESATLETIVTSTTLPAPTAETLVTTDTTDTTTTTELITLEEATVPLGPAETETFSENIVPLGPIDLPRTGEYLQALLMLIGLLSMITGAVLLFVTRNK